MSAGAERYRKRARMCAQCQERPAKFSRHGGKVHAKADHDLCAECWRALRNRTREVDSRPPLVIHIRAGAVGAAIELPATMPWFLQDRAIRGLVKKARAVQAQQFDALQKRPTKGGSAA